MSDYDQDPNIVKQVQTAVNAQGYQPQLVVDGVYGPATQAGVTWFQGQHGLVQDGIIGDATLAATISIPTPSGPALVPPVTTLPSGQKVIHLNLHGISHMAPLAPALAPPPKTIKLNLTGISHMAPLAPALGPGAPPHLQPVPVKKVSWPTWVGLVMGTAIGTIFGGPPLGTAIGAVVGGAGGAGTSALINRKHATPALPPGGATMHGEAEPFGCEISADDAPIIAGDMGVPSKYKSMRG